MKKKQKLCRAKKWKKRKIKPLQAKIMATVFRQSPLKVFFVHHSRCMLIFGRKKHRRLGLIAIHGVTLITVYAL